MKSKTLIIQPLPGIGDMVWYVSYLKAIARQTLHGKVSILTKSSVKVDELLGHEPFIEHCLTLNPIPKTPLGALRLANFLKSYSFQSSWVLHHNPRYGLATWLAGIPKRYGYGFGRQKLFLNNPPYLPQSYKKQEAHGRMKAFFEKHQIIPKEEDLFLTPCPQALSWVSRKYEIYPKPWIVLGMGASEPLRRWPLHFFVELGTYLKQKMGGTLFFLCSPSEKALGVQAQKLAHEKGLETVLIHDLKLNQSEALMSKAHLYVGNCSGPLNISGCLKVPSFGLSGISRPLTYCPYITSITPTPGREYLGMRGILPQDVLKIIESYFKP